MSLNITSSAVFTAQMTSRAHEYASEAEHQEGKSYWKDNFKNDEEVIQDFILFLENRRTG